MLLEISVLYKNINLNGRKNSNKKANLLLLHNAKYSEVVVEVTVVVLLVATTAASIRVRMW